jgi:phospholipid transport system transporter-binding protein
MNQAELINQGAGVFTLTGSLKFSTVDTLLLQGKALADGGHSIVLDLANVSHATSVGLALLLEWQEQAQQRGQQLQIQNAPSALLDIASISNCAAILNFT